MMVSKWTQCKTIVKLKIKNAGIKMVSMATAMQTSEFCDKIKEYWVTQTKKKNGI